jgi:hypothetical protein
MALEVATYISQLIPTNPLPTDNESQGQGHLTLIKSVLQNSFPNINGAANASSADLTALAGAATTGASIQVITQPSTDASTNAASTNFVAQAQFNTVLPAQAGHAGGVMTTNGSAASWTANNSGVNGYVMSSINGVATWAQTAIPDFLLMAQGVI